MNYDRGERQTNTHTQTDRHINTMTQPGLRAGPSENSFVKDKEFIENMLSIYGEEFILDFDL